MRNNKFALINFSPYATNVLDVIGSDLVTRDGRAVRVESGMRGFKVFVNGTLVRETDSNLDVSYLLNQMEVGY